MLKDKLVWIRNYIMKHSKIVFPVIIIVAVAITVAVALGAVAGKKADEIVPESSAVVSEGDYQEKVPLVKNEDNAISELIYAYYNAQANGDLETLQSLCDEVSDLDLLSFEEKAKYIDYYPTLEIYTKAGLGEGETIVYVYYRMTFVNHEEEFPGYTSHYVCTADDGSLYIKRSNFSEELNAYTSRVCAEDDVVEFNNRVIAEYDAFKEEHPELASYPEEVMTQVNMTVGVKWAEMGDSSDGDSGDTDVSTSDVPAEVSGGDSTEEQRSDEPMYATALTTVNVRNSDSEKADRLGKVTGGTRIQVLEQKVNGWSKVLFENKEGYIKSEFLQTEESAAGQQSIGMVVASTNINVRSAASETAQKLGVLSGGSTAELIADEGDWCKIKYNGSVGYVKSEYVEKQ